MSYILYIRPTSILYNIHIYRNQSIAPFCDYFTADENNPQNLNCNLDRTAVAFCNLVDNYFYVASFVSIPREYQVNFKFTNSYFYDCTCSI